MKTFVDTNVLVYAHDADAGARHTTAKALLTELWDNRNGSLSTQVLQEFYAVLTRKFRPRLDSSRANCIQWATTPGSVAQYRCRNSRAGKQLEKPVCFMTSMILVSV